MFVVHERHLETGRARYERTDMTTVEVKVNGLNIGQIVGNEYRTRRSLMATAMIGFEARDETRP
jgi:hypothetical protein